MPNPELLKLYIAEHLERVSAWTAITAKMVERSCKQLAKSREIILKSAERASGRIRFWAVRTTSPSLCHIRKSGRVRAPQLAASTFMKEQVPRRPRAAAMEAAPT